MRIIPTIHIKNNELQTLLSACNLTPISDLVLAKEGKIASNYTIETREIGKVILRIYPSDFNETKVAFETRALRFLADNGVVVPRPVNMFNTLYTRTENGNLGFVYPYIEGFSLLQSAIDVDIAAKAGENLAQIINVSLKYKSVGYEPNGDIEFIRHIFMQFCQTHQGLLSDHLIKEMNHVLNDHELNEWLLKTPNGIVHADYFFENLLFTSDGTLATIDFGDSYFGSPATDICIGAMEFSVNHNEEWNMNHTKAFLKPLQHLIQIFELNDERFLKLLRINCIRFAVYTIPLTLQESQPAHLNPYVKRFEYLKAV